MDKLRRKLERKMHKGHQDGGFSEDDLTHEQMVRSRREAFQAKLAAPNDLAANVAALPGDSGYTGSGWGQKLSMPNGTTRTWSPCGEPPRTWHMKIISLLDSIRAFNFLDSI
jgi:hypothetical protein